MSFFKSKEKVNAEAFCRVFYNNNLLENEIPKSHCRIVREQIIKVDENFENIGFQNFYNQLLLIRLELFGMAWLHEFGDKHAVKNSVFTKQYLNNVGWESIWENGITYNKAVAQSAIHGCDSSTMAGRARLLFVNTNRVKLFEYYHKEGIDNFCVARVLNRFGTDEKWKSMSTTHIYLITELYKKLNCEINESGTHILIATLKGLYEGSKQAIGNVKIVS